jgi:hypothetical protein
MTTGFVHVRFCEIPRIYDLFFGPGVHGQQRRMVDRGGPKQIEHLDRVDLGIWDEAGNDIRANFPEIPPPMKGVYRSFSVSQMTTVLRTFARDPNSQPVKAGAYVYVLSDTEEKGKLRLVHILYFHRDGEYRQVKLDQPDTVSDKLPVEKELLLEQIVLDRRVRNCALLSPFALPPAVVKALKDPSSDDEKVLHANALARSSWLDDPFTCDIGTGTRAAPPTPEQVQKYAKDKVTELDLGERVLYLVNPFTEAIRRADAYQRAVDAAIKAQMEAGSNRRYVLAKRIEAVVMQDEKRKELVEPRLSQDIDKIERPISVLWMRAEDRAADLLRWCGYAYQPLGWTWFSGSLQLDQVTFGVISSTGKTVAWQKELAPEQKESANWLSAAIWEARDGSEEQDDMLGALATGIYDRLDHTEVGRKFLQRQTDRCLGTEAIKPGKDDGLLGALIAAKKPLNAGVKAWGGVLKNLLPWWYMRKGELTFSTLADFIKDKTGTDIRSQEIKADRQRVSELKQTHRQEFDARRQKAKRFIPKGKNPTSAFKSSAANAAKAGLALAKLASLWETIGEARKKKNPWSVVAVVSGLLSTGEAIADVVPEWTSFKKVADKLTFRSYTIRSEKYVGYAKFKFLGTVAGALDTVLALRSVANAHGSGATAGYSLKALGAAVGMVGSVAAETGIGLGVALLGLALQATGDWVISYTEALNVYLRTSLWGPSPKGDVDIDSLMQEFDRILYDFTWEVGTKAASSEGVVRVFLDVKPVRWLGLIPSEAQLEANLTLVRETRPPQTYATSAVLDAEFLSSSQTWAILLAELPWAEAAGSIQLKGALSLKLDRPGLRHVDAAVDKLTAVYDGGRAAGGSAERPDGGVGVE